MASAASARARPLGRADGTTVGVASLLLGTHPRLLLVVRGTVPAWRGVSPVSDTGDVQAYTVASGIIVQEHEILLVQNKRRNGSLDWSTPGGVVDPGEEIVEALQREVIEETAVVVNGWSQPLYTVDVEFVGREMSLHAQVFRANGFGGEVHVDDPDHVVVDACWADLAAAKPLLETSPPWVYEPLLHEFDSVFDEGHGTAASPSVWTYRVTGKPGGFVTERIQTPD